jgi:hypothetical protein
MIFRAPVVLRAGFGATALVLLVCGAALIWHVGGLAAAAYDTLIAIMVAGLPGPAEGR